MEHYAFFFIFSIFQITKDNIGFDVLMDPLRFGINEDF